MPNAAACAVAASAVTPASAAAASAKKNGAVTFVPTPSTPTLKPLIEERTARIMGLRIDAPRRALAAALRVMNAARATPPRRRIASLIRTERTLSAPIPA